jgi:hypothetical protein
MVNPNEKYKDQITFYVYGEYSRVKNNKKITKKNIYTKRTCWKKDIVSIEELIGDDFKPIKEKFLVYLYGEQTPLIIKGNYNEYYSLIYGEDVHKNPSIVEIKGFKNENIIPNKQKNKRLQK